MKSNDLDPDPELDPTWIHRIRIHQTDIFLIQESGEDKEFMVVRKSLPAWDKRHEIIRLALKTFLIPSKFLFLRIFIFLKIRDFLRRVLISCSLFLLQTIWESYAIAFSWYENIQWVRSSNPLLVLVLRSRGKCDDLRVLKVEKNIKNNFTQKEIIQKNNFFPDYVMLLNIELIV
jgi:hypothetical protein